jgi:zinc protease
LLVVGDLDKNRVEKAIAALNERWPAKEVALPVLNFAPVPETASLHFVDLPDAKQSVINIGYLALPRNHPDFYKAEVANYMLGGGVSARFFMVLREEKGYTYGAYSNFSGYKNYGTFTANAAVRSDATFESLRLFREIMEQYRSSIPEETVAFTKGSLLKANTRRFETSGDLLGMLSTISSYGLPFDYVSQEEDFLRSIDSEKLTEIAQKYINPSRMYYVVVGDAKTQMSSLEKIGIGKPVAMK